MTEELKIEAGKYYKTRDGKKAYVGAVVQDNPFSGRSADYPGQGYVEGGSSSEVFSWTSLGVYNRRTWLNDYDLVEEWKEPAKETVWLSFVRYSESNDTTSVIITDKPPEKTMFSGSIIAKRQVTITEGEGLDEVATESAE